MRLKTHPTIRPKGEGRPTASRADLRAWSRSPGRYVAPILFVAGGTGILYLLRDHLLTTEAALVYLLLVVLSATTAGAGPARSFLAQLSPVPRHSPLAEPAHDAEKGRTRRKALREVASGLPALARRERDQGAGDVTWPDGRVGS